MTTTETTPDVPDAFDASAATSRGVLGTIEHRGVNYDVARKAPALLVAEITRSGTLPRLAELIEHCLGDSYAAFRAASIAADDDYDDLWGVASQLARVSSGRPTK